MAKEIFRGEFHCDVCKENFPFKSRLVRHLSSAAHRVMEATLSKHRQPIPRSSQQYQTTGSLYHDDLEEQAVDNDHESDENSSDEWQNEDVDGLVDEITTLSSGDFSPFPNKQFAMLYLLLNGPHPIGETSLAFIWHIIKECGVDIPSITTLKMWKLPGLTLPSKHLSPDGTPFHCISVATVVQQFIGNPKVSSMIARYPVHTNGPYREIYHAQCWRNDSCYHTPMVSLMDGTHVFVRDCVYFNHTQFGIVRGVVLKFFAMNLPNEIYCEIEVLLSNEQFCSTPEHPSDCFIPNDCFVIYHTVTVPISLIQCLSSPPTSIIKWSEHRFQRFDLQETTDYFAPHALKVKAAGRPVVVMPVVLFCDDTSGNRSKKWHAFNSWYLIFAGLSHQENAKLPNLVFLCTSDRVSPLDMSTPIVTELEKLKNDGVQAYDAHQKMNVLVISPVICIICDNPRASELANHLGSTANKFCRFCMADRIGSPTTIAECRTLEKSIAQISEIKSARTNERKAALSTLYGLRATPNAFLCGLKLNIYQALPVEPLHTIPLGSCKYILQQVMPLFSLRQKKEILASVKAFSMSGFETKMYGNVCWYYGSFVGRDFKAWSQMAPFILDSYISEGHRKVLLSYSKVFQIMYCDNFSPALLDKWQAICQSFVDTVNEFMPELIHKLKIHLVLHIPQCFMQYGPTAAFSAERFESYNAKVREQNIFSNRRAPSRDIAKHFAILQHIRAVTDGGYYGNYDKCGAGLRDLYSSDCVQAYLSGTSRTVVFSGKQIYQHGSPRLVCHKSKTSDMQSLAIGAVGYGECCLQELQSLTPPFEVILTHAHAAEKVYQYRGVVSKSLQLVHSGEYVELCVPFENLKFGVLLTTCKSTDGSVFCVIQGFQPCCNSGVPLISHHDCPMFELTKTIFTTEATNILKAVSFVHLCADSCNFEETSTPVLVEQEEVDTTGLHFVHDYKNYMYCYNVYCMC